MHTAKRWSLIRTSGIAGLVLFLAGIVFSSVHTDATNVSVLGILIMLISIVLYCARISSWYE